MQSPQHQREIEFTADREHWHTGRAEGGDLFYRTRTVLNGTPTAWKAYLLPVCFIGQPLWMVWELLKETDPYSVEEYDEFQGNLKLWKAVIGG